MSELIHPMLDNRVTFITYDSAQIIKTQNLWELAKNREKGNFLHLFQRELRYLDSINQTTDEYLRSAISSYTLLFTRSFDTIQFGKYSIEKSSLTVADTTNLKRILIDPDYGADLFDYISRMDKLQNPFLESYIGKSLFIPKYYSDSLLWNSQSLEFDEINSIDAYPWMRVRYQDQYFIQISKSQIIGLLSETNISDSFNQGFRKVLLEILSNNRILLLIVDPL